MKFPHEDPGFKEMLSTAAKSGGLRPGLVEKDYWVTHVLWSLQQTGLEYWFKGGTSLSKGFGLIKRFSEDLDLMIEPGRTALPSVSSWTSTGKGPIEQRRSFFAGLVHAIPIHGAQLTVDGSFVETKHRQAMYRVEFPRFHAATLGRLRPFVQVEVGGARVTPFVGRDMTSFVHEHLVRLGLNGEFVDNRPIGFPCLHPIVTLLEKIDALQRRVPGDRAAGDFVRHYEDAARIIENAAALPPLPAEWPTPRALAEDLLANKQIDAMPSPDHVAFALDSGARTTEIERAHAELADMFWGAQLSLQEATETIRKWIQDSI